MNIGNGCHLTYCTNIHPGETWAAVFESLQTYLLPVKAAISPDKPFGVGLRLSNVASKELETSDNLAQFKEWLEQRGLYVFTMNGFPFGNFHRVAVKDDVHQPDWTTPERLEYTQRLARILAHLVPEGLEGSISTSPLSYKGWFAGDTQKTAQVFRESTHHLALLVEYLMHLRQETGKLVHIDIEPEPDGLLENAGEFIAYFDSYLCTQASDYLQSRLGISALEAGKAIKEHLRLCYDVCHFALAYEEPATVLKLMLEKGIKIGKIQVSAALKADLPADPAARKALENQFKAFTESTYLHQVLVKNTDGSLTQYPDLPPALPHLYDAAAQEWRTHFHVPVFLDKYQTLQSTQAEIIKVLHLQKQNPFTRYLEVETYTWEVLPPEIKQDLVSSIVRELNWVTKQLSLPA